MKQGTLSPTKAVVKLYGRVAEVDGATWQMD
jgi:hypothetical protein